MSTNFYVYAYIRCKSSKTAEVNTPYYIGKGKEKRAWNKDRNGKHGNVHIPANENHIIIVEHNLTEIGALALERRLITWYGRKDIGTGILENRTDGGDGVSGLKHSDETKKLLSEINTGKTHTTETKQLLSDIAKGVPKPPRSDEHKLNISISKTGIKDSDETKRKKSESAKGKHTGPLSETHVASLSEAAKNRKLLTCPHCGASGRSGSLYRNHFDKCKFKPVELES